MWGSRYKDVNALIGFLWGLQIGVHFVSKPDGTTSYRIAVVMEDDSILLIQQNGEDVPPWMWVSISRRYWSLLTSAGSVLEYTGYAWLYWTILAYAKGLLEYTGICRSVVEYTGICRSVVEYTGICRSVVEYTGICRSVVEYTGICRSVVEYTGICRSVLVGSVLDYTGICKSVLEYTDIQSSPGAVMWVREEALASIAALEYLDLPAGQEAAIERFMDASRNEPNPLKVAISRLQLQVVLIKVWH